MKLIVLPLLKVLPLTVFVVVTYLLLLSNNACVSNAASDTVEFYIDVACINGETKYYYLNSRISARILEEVVKMGVEGGHNIVMDMAYDRSCSYTDLPELIQKLRNSGVSQIRISLNRDVDIPEFTELNVMP